MRVATLPVMHDGYRLSLAAMQQLVEHVRRGGRFDAPIFVTRFEDGREMLRDGLHRATAVLLGRSSGALEPGEVVIEPMTYDMFRSPALEAGLYAPFDPVTEVRVADFRGFRDQVLARANGDVDAFIAAHRDVYVRPRQPYHDTLARFFAERSPYGAELAA